jgi:hypothetical protein
MDETGSDYTPAHAGPPRRGMFQRPASVTADTRVIEEELGITRALQRTIDERLEHGLRTLEEQATVLMREIASEVWRASGSDARPEQERIVSLLSRDQAIRSLIASSDERFQTLAVRSMRLEDHLGEIAQATRATRETMESSTKAIRQIADSPSLRGIEGVRSQLEQVERHIAETFSHLDERDRAVTETILRQVQEHGDLIARETTRVVEAMQNYVQGGTEAMGQLAQRVEQHAETFSVQDIRIADDVRTSVTEATEPLQARLDLISESVGMHGRAQDDIRASVERLIEARMRGLAELIRSDSSALRTLIEERQESGAVEIDDEAMAETIGRQVAMRLTSAELRLEDRLEKMMDAQLLRIGEQVDARLHDHLEARFDTMSEVVALRAAEAATGAIASSFGQTLEDMNSNVGAIEGIDTMIAESQAVAEERLMAHIDDRMTGIARLIRSDNQALAARISAQPPTVQAAGPSIDPELLRETIRTMKEVQAGLASEMVGSVDSRFRAVSDQLHSETQSTAEAMIKVAEVLGQKIDRLSVRVDEGNGNELQVVIDRMTDAIRAMSAARPQRYEQLG